MAISAFTTEKTGSAAWLYEWTGTSPFDVYRDDGELLLKQTTLTSLTVEGPDLLEPPALLVRDASDTGLAEIVEFSPRVTIQWRGESTASFYKVQQFVDAAWVNRKVVVEAGLGYYRDETLALTDVTTASLRVISFDEEGNESEPLLVDVFVVRNPPPPSISISYSSGTGLITVAAR